MIFSQMEAELSGMHSHAGAWKEGIIWVATPVIPVPEKPTEYY